MKQHLDSTATIPVPSASAHKDGSCYNGSFVGFSDGHNATPAFTNGSCLAKKCSPPHCYHDSDLVSQTQGKQKQDAELPPQEVHRSTVSITDSDSEESNLGTANHSSKTSLRSESARSKPSSEAATEASKGAKKRRGEDVTEVPTGEPKSKRIRTRQDTAMAEAAAPWISKKTSRVGSEYQVASLPKAGSCQMEANTYKSSGQVLWNSTAVAASAMKNQKRVQRMLDMHSRLPIKMLVMQALHESNYDPKKAMICFIRLVQEKQDGGENQERQGISSAPTEEEQLELEQLFTSFQQSKPKDFRAIAQATEQSIDGVMVWYYGWKGGKRWLGKKWRPGKKG